MSCEASFNPLDLAPEVEGNPDLLAKKYERFGRQEVIAAPSRGDLSDISKSSPDADVNPIYEPLSYLTPINMDDGFPPRNPLP